MTSSKPKKLLALLLASATLSGMLAVGSNAAAGYTDVEEDRWSVDDIAYATEKGYMNGVGDNRFNPDGDMERAMIVTVLYRMEGEPEAEYNGKFEDVPDGEYYSAAVTWASEVCIANGTTETKFEPHSAVTREQMAAFFSRYAETKYINTEKGADITGYEDYEDIYDYAIAPFAWANKFGIINGDTKTTLSPKKTATREQFAAILHRFETAEFTPDDYHLVWTEPMANWEYNPEYPLVTDANFYVAVNGSDTADGSIDHPFATFARAKEAVRELKKTATSEIKVAFKAGNYGELGNIQFTAEDSGTSSVPITYCAYGDGPVVFSGGATIKADQFRPIDESDYYLFNEKEYANIYKADVSDIADVVGNIEVLFSGSGVAYEARYPNKNADGSDKYIVESTTTHNELESIELQGVWPHIVSKFRTLEGAKVTGYLRTGWLVDTFPVKSYDPNTNILVFDMENWKNTNGYPLSTFPLMYEGRTPDKIFFHNLSDQLDYEGEYWYDTSTKTLYVYKPEGDYTVAVGGQFMTITNASYLSFVGLTFNGSTGRGVETLESHYLTFDGCTFSNIAGDYALNVRYAQAFTFKNNELYNFGANGLEIYARIKTERRYIVSQDIVIDNNYFHDFGFVDSWSQAFEINEAVGTQITHNYFKNGAHGAVRYNRCIDTVIEYNVFDNMMATSDDYGAVYTDVAVLFRSNYIRYNLFKNMGTWGGRFGIYLDDYTSGQEVYGNIFYNSASFAVCIHDGRDNEIHDNIMVTVGQTTSFLAYTTGAYRYVAEGGDLDKFYDSDAMYSALKELNEIEEENLAIWKERWPQLFRYNYDPEKVGERDCIFTTVNYIENNIIIGTDLSNMSDTYELFAVGKETNRIYKDMENPIFTNPTIGDYSLKEGVDFPYIDVAQIGRR